MRLSVGFAPGFVEIGAFDNHGVEGTAAIAFEFTGPSLDQRSELRRGFGGTECSATRSAVGYDRLQRRVRRHPGEDDFAGVGIGGEDIDQLLEQLLILRGELALDGSRGDGPFGLRPGGDLAGISGRGDLLFQVENLRVSGRHAGLRLNRLTGKHGLYGLKLAAMSGNGLSELGDYAGEV